MANTFAFIEKTLAGVFDDVYFSKSFTEKYFKDNAIVAGWENNGKVCKIFNLSTSGYTNYARGGHGGTNANGTIVSKLESFELTQERWASFLVDRLDSIDDGESVLGKLASQFARTQHVYELDTYRFSVIAGYTSTLLGNRIVEDVDNNTAFAKLQAGIKYLKNKHVNKQDLVIFASVSAITEFKKSTEITKKIEVVRANDKDYNFEISYIDGIAVEEIPDDTLYTDAYAGDNGIYPTTDSKLINFLIVDKSGPIGKEHIAWSKVYSSDETDLGFAGNKLSFLTYHDCMVPDNKVFGIYASVSNTPAVARELAVDFKAGAASKAKIKIVLTNPEGIAWDKLYLSTSATIPAIGSSTSALTEVKIGVDFTPDSAHNVIVASLDGKAVAVSKDYTTNIPVGQ